MTDHEPSGSVVVAGDYRERLAGALRAGAFLAAALRAGAALFAGAFLAGAFLAGAFLAGAFLAAAFLGAVIRCASSAVVCASLQLARSRGRCAQPQRQPDTQTLFCAILRRACFEKRSKSSALEVIPLQHK